MYVSNIFRNYIYRTGNFELVKLLTSAPYSRNVFTFNGDSLEIFSFLFFFSCTLY